MFNLPLYELLCNGSLLNVMYIMSLLCVEGTFACILLCIWYLNNVYEWFQSRFVSKFMTSIAKGYATLIWMVYYCGWSGQMHQVRVLCCVWKLSTPKTKKCLAFRGSSPDTSFFLFSKPMISIMSTLGRLCFSKQMIMSHSVHEPTAG